MASSLWDVLTGNHKPYDAPVRAVGQGGSKNPFAASGFGYGRNAIQGGGVSLPAGTNLNMEWAGNNLEMLSRMPRDQAMAIARTAGANTGSQLRAPPPPVRNPFFSNDWSGMRRNIGMPASGGGLAGLASAFGAGAMGGAMGGQPQRSPFGGGGPATLAQLGQLLGMFGGGGY